MSFDLSTAFLLSKNNSAKDADLVSMVPLDMEEVMSMVPVGTQHGTYKLLFSDGSMLIIDCVNKFTAFYLASSRKISMVTQVNGYKAGSPLVMSSAEFPVDLVINRDAAHVRGCMTHPVLGSDMVVKMVL
jgi:hypothetical protein